MELNFSEDYFKGEEINGFFVEEMMKRAWAAQLVVLKEFDEVCKRYGLRWQAGYGTLLGAVRHKGYIPWDDDMDINMPRQDYMTFINKAIKDLPKEYFYFNIYTDSSMKDYLTRIVNHPSIDFSGRILDKYYGFPYACGIDICPIDYIPRDKVEAEVLYNLIEMTSTAANNMESDEEDYQEQKRMLANIEKMTKVKIDRGRNIPQQLRILTDRLCGMYGPEDSDNMGMAIRQKDVPDYNSPKEFYEETIMMPFECTEIPVPKGYDEILRKHYGDYMVENKQTGHDYPFYAKQQAALEEYKKQSGQENVLRLSLR